MEERGGMGGTKHERGQEEGKEKMVSAFRKEKMVSAFKDVSSQLV